LRREAIHIAIIVLMAIILHLPFFTGWLKPIPPNFTWWAPWNEKIAETPPKGSYYDSLQQYIPWQKYLQDSIAQGELPLWNRFQFCGTPFLANHLLSPFYPPITIGLGVPFELSLYVISFFHFLIGPVFMYLYLRRIGLDSSPSLVGGLIFCSTGMFMPFYPPWPAAIVWLPAILFIIEGWLQGKRGWHDAPWLALILAFWSMEGYPIFIVHSIYFIVFYILLVRPAVNRVSTLGRFFVALFTGGAISAVQNLPTLFFAIESARFVPEVDELLSPVFALPYMLNHLLPVQSGAYKIGYHFIGLVPFLIMPFAAVRPDSRAKYHFFWFGACLVLGLIPHLFVSIYRILPLWAITPHPPIIAIFFSSAVLSAYGTQHLWYKAAESKHPLKWALFVGVVIFLVVFILQATKGVTNTFLFYILCCAALLCFLLISILRTTSSHQPKVATVATIAIILLIITVPWFINFRCHQPVEELFNSPIYQNHLVKLRASNLRVYRYGWQQNLPPNTSILWGIEDAGGYDSLILKRYFDEVTRNGFKFYRGREMLPLDGSPYIDDNMLEEFSIGLILASPDSSRPGGAGWGLLTLTDGGVRLYVKRNVPRALFIPKGCFMDEAIPLKYTVTSPNSIKVDIGGGKEEGSVVVRDAYAGGWKAWVDGERVPIEPYRGWMRQVDVPAGARDIAMRYEPVEFTIGIFISAFSLFVTLSWLAGGYRRKLTK
jgi:hypothetical protein